MRIHLGRFAAAAAVLVASAAQAGVVTFTMENGDDGGMPFNTVFFTIRNDSAPGVSVLGVTMDVGDPAFLYDQLYLRREAFLGGDGTQTATLEIGTRTDDGAGPDVFEYSFVQLGPGVTFTGQWDIDLDTGAVDVDARTVLFNNGLAPNATMTITFSDGSVALYQFPDLPSASRYELVIPAPGTAAALVPALLAGLRRRRR